MSEADRWREEARAEVSRRREELFDLLRRLHAEPELGFREERAAGRLRAALGEAGYRVEAGIAGLPTAFRARLVPSGRPGGGEGAPPPEGKDVPPVIAILAEYDALPQLGHACGHNWIAAAALGAGLGLAPLRGRLPGEVQVIGCPAEEGAVEGAGGKVVLLREGCFRGVGAALMVHPAGQTAILSSSSARAALEVTFLGRSAHAASGPNAGINALDAAIAAFNNWYALRARLQDEAQVHGIISEGGHSPNVIPERAQVRLYVRARDGARLEEVLERVREGATAAALATRARVEFRETAHRYLSLRSNQTLGGRFREHLLAAGLPAPLGPVRASGSTDMGNVSQALPAIHPYVAAVPPGVALHTREFARAILGGPARRALVAAAQALACTAIDFLAEERFREAAASEFRQGGRSAGLGLAGGE